jgi:hypothetical protein
MPPVPNGYEECYLCELLGLSYTELQKQPLSWTKKMTTWKEAKNAAEGIRMEQQQKNKKKS